MNADNGVVKQSKCECRLTVIGKSALIHRFNEKEEWPVEFEEVEILEMSSCRMSWQYVSTQLPIPFIRTFSQRWPLTFLVDYDTGKVKGMASIKNNMLRHYRIRYR
jgi:hypothetical protein